MVRKRRTPLPAGGGDSSEPQEAAGGSSRGTPHQPESGAPPQQGYAPQTQQGGRGGGYGGRGRGGVPQHHQQQQQQHYGGPSECQGRGRGGGGPPQGGRGGYGSGRGGGPSSGDPPGPPDAQLYQATPAAYGVTPQAMSEASSSSRTPSFIEVLQKLPPASSKSMSLPHRPRMGGSAGKKCRVKANHFSAELQDKNLHQYHVTITPEVTSSRVNRAVMKQLVNQESHPGKCLPAYDGRQILYTAGPLPFPPGYFNITFVDEEDGFGGQIVDQEDGSGGQIVDQEDGSGGQRRKRVFRVEIKFAALVDLQHLALFSAGRLDDAPKAALQALDIVLREGPTSRGYFPVGRSFYSPDLKQTLGEGLERRPGFFQSIRPTQMGLSLNIDMSSTAFFEPLPVIEFVTKLLNQDVSARPLSESDRVKIEKALRGVKVEVTHRINMRRKYCISGLTFKATQDLTFHERGTRKSVVEYFQETYGCEIRRTQLPCLQVGNQQKLTYLPMEVCKIVKGQRYSKGLNKGQIAALLDATRLLPEDREKDIVQTVSDNAYNNNPYAKEFGIKINNQLASVEARILPAPWLRYLDDTGRVKNCQPQFGQWSMMDKKMVDPGRVDSWICMNFSPYVDNSAVDGFCYELALMCRNKGMYFAPKPSLPTVTYQPEQVETDLKARYSDALTQLQPHGKKLGLLIAILPDNSGSLYGDLKRICETDLGLVSQCCSSKHVCSGRKTSRRYLANVSLKINVKVGGRNTVLVDALVKSIPFICAVPTIIFGADVTHHRQDSFPSIAAVVASQDWPQMSKYAGLVCAQAPRQELIQDLYKEWHDPVRRGTVSGGMIKEHLTSFSRANGMLPDKIIFYRDGVGDGQFYQVLRDELTAIFKACASIRDDYIPKVTFVVVQKRHHTRLFANNHHDLETVDRSGNILPGTVVDSTICHPTEFDFYLCSHAGIQGTSRPARYHVLWDDNKFTADGLQLLTYNLCYTYARCTQSVSIVPPVYYAHILAKRARLYMEPETVGGPSGGPSVNAAVIPLPALKENVKRVMFYC